MRTKTMFALMIAGALVLCLATTQPAIAASDEEEVLQVISNIYKATNTSDPNMIEGLYNSELYSTFGSPKFLAFLTQGRELIESFKKFLSEQPAGTFSGSFHNPQVTFLGKNVAIVTGYEIFMVNPPVASEQVIEQNRATIVLQKTNGKWLVVHDHYSHFPTD